MAELEFQPLPVWFKISSFAFMYMWFPGGRGHTASLRQEPHLTHTSEVFPFLLSLLSECRGVQTPGIE